MPDDKQKEISDIRKKMTEIEIEHKGISNIPITHEYYKLRNRLQALENE